MEEFDFIMTEIDIEICNFCKAMDEIDNVIRIAKAAKKLEEKYNKLMEVSVI